MLSGTPAADLRCVRCFPFYCCPILPFNLQAA